MTDVDGAQVGCEGFADVYDAKAVGQDEGGREVGGGEGWGLGFGELGGLDAHYLEGGNG